MENYLQYLASTDDFAFKLNTDILETNVINLGLLLIILFVVIKNFLQENLGMRKTKIVEAIEKAENSLADSRKRYTEAKKQWSQISLMIQEINNQMEKTKQNVVKTKWDEAKEDLSKRFSIAVEILRNREKKLFSEIIKEVSQKALTRVTIKLKNQLGKAEQSEIVNRKIKQLGD
uniref:ATP synthase CF0, subunit B n=1 Tax=Phaeostrophion irregulare TaxID=243268 RepID=UPI002E76FF9E|nr:ATP synthase CF0, subunit B [Phaeostrophion irregulare]WAM64357.1 ATP synthase CF0, subunit B [Phaeostrophion irregulare]